MNSLLNMISLDELGFLGGGLILLIFIFQHLLKNNNILKDDAERRDYRQDLLVANKELTERCDSFANDRNELIIKHAREVSDYEKQISNLEWRIRNLQESIRKCDCKQIEDKV